MTGRPAGRTLGDDPSLRAIDARGRREEGGTTMILSGFGAALVMVVIRLRHALAVRGLPDRAPLRV